MNAKAPHAGERDPAPPGSLMIVDLSARRLETDEIIVAGELGGLALAGDVAYALNGNGAAI